MKRNCPKRKKDLRDTKPSVVGVAKGPHLGDEGDVFLATVKSQRRSDWRFDSDCSFHMPSVRVDFVTC